jgi:hypothetical protein
MSNWSKAGADDLRTLLATPFALTRTVRSPKGSLRRARTGTIAARRAWRFDVILNRRHFADGDTIANNYSAAVVTLPRRYDGRLGLARRGFLREPKPLDAPEVVTGGEALHRRFSVSATSPQLAAGVLTEPVCAWLAGPGRGFHYELVHDRVLAYGWRRYLGGSGPLDAALQFAACLDGER